MFLCTYLNFNGQCEEALKFYERVLEGKIEALVRYEGTPAAEHAPVELSKKILHGRIRVGDSTLMASDAPPDHFSPPKGFSVTIQATDPAKAERIFGQLAEGGSVLMPIQQTFWAARFGMLVDRFGIPWMVNCEESK